jgi:hypothetical protein
MRGRSALLICGLALAGQLVGTPATARPLDKGHFHDVFTETFRCDGTPVRDNGNVRGNFLFNQRGGAKHPFPYYRESVHGTIVHTNLNTGGTYTEVFTNNARDHKIVNNGDGTITIITFASGGFRAYDQNGTLVLKDPGHIRFAVDVNFHGTPGNPDDDKVIDGSFRIIRESTGRNDTQGRDFCADLVEFTT